MDTKYYLGKKIKGSGFMEEQADLCFSVFLTFVSLGGGVEQKY
jgi:hypothetical protein